MLLSTKITGMLLRSLWSEAIKAFADNATVQSLKSPEISFVFEAFLCELYKGFRRTQKLVTYLII